MKLQILLYEVLLGRSLISSMFIGNQSEIIPGTEMLWVNSSAVLTATHTFLPVAVATLEMLALLEANCVIIADKFVVQSWHWNR
jgi:hypothetical protein